MYIYNAEYIIIDVYFSLDSRRQNQIIDNQNVNH